MSVGGLGGLNNSNFQPKITDKSVINNKVAENNSVSNDKAIPTFNLKSQFVSGTNTKNAGFEPVSLFNSNEPKSVAAKTFSDMNVDLVNGPREKMAEKIANMLYSI